MNGLDFDSIDQPRLRLSSIDRSIDRPTHLPVLRVSPSNQRVNVPLPGYGTPKLATHPSSETSEEVASKLTDRGDWHAAKPLTRPTPLPYHHHHRWPVRGGCCLGPEPRRPRRLSTHTKTGSRRPARRRTGCRSEQSPRGGGRGVCCAARPSLRAHQFSSRRPQPSTTAGHRQQRAHWPVLRRRHHRPIDNNPRAAAAALARVASPGAR